MLTVLLIGAVNCDAPEYEENEDVIQLTEDNFDSIINHYEFVLVKFYAPWCGHCKKIAPEYVKAAAVLKENDPPIYLGEIDATEEKSLGGRFDVKGYPTLKFFIGGDHIEYNGGRDE